MGARPGGDPRGRSRGRARRPAAGELRELAGRADRAQPAPAAHGASTRSALQALADSLARARRAAARARAPACRAAPTSSSPASAAGARRSSPGSRRCPALVRAATTTPSRSRSRSSRTWPARTSTRSRRRAPCAALVEELGLTREEVGRRVGRSRVAVSNLLRLLDLPDEALDLIGAGELTEGHGRALLLADDHADRRRLARSRRRAGLVGARDRGRARARPTAAAPARRHRAARAAPHPDQEAAADRDRRRARPRARRARSSVRPRGDGLPGRARLRLARRRRSRWRRAWARLGGLRPPSTRRYTAAAAGRLAQSVRALL